MREQVNELPAIVERLGRSISLAQKGLNADYVESVGALMKLIQETAPMKGSNKEQREFYQDLLIKIMPARYRFEETILEFSVDLSERFNIGGAASLGLGMSAVTINASVTGSYGRDYNAAARLKTTLVADQPGVEETAKAREIINNSQKKSTASKPGEVALQDLNQSQLLEELKKVVSDIASASGFSLEDVLASQATVKGATDLVKAEADKIKNETKPEVLKKSADKMKALTEVATEALGEANSAKEAMASEAAAKKAAENAAKKAGEDTTAADTAINAMAKATDDAKKATDDAAKKAADAS